MKSVGHRLSWDSGEYEYGLNRGVFYPQAGSGEAWNGLISVEEEETDSEAKPRYLDGARVGNRQTGGYFAGRISAYSYPNAFYRDVLSQRWSLPFGMSYRTTTKDHYRLHLVYNVLLSPNSHVRGQNESETYTWDFATLPIEVSGAKKTAHLVVETSTAYSWVVSALEDVLYGTDDFPPRLPSPDEVMSIFEAGAILKIVDNGDGTWTATGPDEAITMLDSSTFEINWPSAVFITSDTYRISSL